MGLKEYIERKRKEKTAPKYSIHRLMYAYTIDGQFIAPFVFNESKTKVKDIETGRVVDLKDGEYSYENIKRALCELFSIDMDKEIVKDSLLDLIERDTYGDSIPGKIFKSVRSQIFLDPHRRDTIIAYGSINNIVASVYDIKPLTKQLSKNLQEKYEILKNRQSVLSSAEENIKF